MCYTFAQFDNIMKKIIFCGIAAILALASCNSKGTTESAETATPAQETVQAVITAPVATDGKVIELSDASLISPDMNVKQLTILDFNAVWCGPCRNLAPVLEQMAEKYKGRVTFISIDVDKFGSLFEAFKLGSSIPAVVFIKPNGERKVYIGTGELLPDTAFEAIIDANLN